MPLKISEKGPWKEKMHAAERHNFKNSSFSSVIIPKDANERVEGPDVQYLLVPLSPNTPKTTYFLYGSLSVFSLLRMLIDAAIASVFLKEEEDGDNDDDDHDNGNEGTGFSVTEMRKFF
uniref:Peptidase_S9 domain-containing protein n=1 Tax=Angiostrongylus cantonensis TaxID=6313 RepID=A0A0K0D3F2_ANGCA